MKTVIDFILTIVILIMAANYTGKAVYFFIKKEAVLRIQAGLPPLQNFSRAMTGSLD